MFTKIGHSIVYQSNKNKQAFQQIFKGKLFKDKYLSQISGDSSVRGVSQAYSQLVKAYVFEH